MPGGGFFPRGGDHDRMEGFRELPEEERQKVRAAFEKVWNDPEVIAARDQLMKANEEYRQKLHAALEKADPDVVKILEKAKPPGPRMPDPADPEFAKKAVQRLAMEIQFWAQQQPGGGDRRGEFVMRIHERLMAVAAVREALQQLEKADPAHRIEAWNHLRDTYQAAAKTEFPRAGNREGHRREGPPENKPGPPPVPQPPQQDKPKE